MERKIRSCKTLYETSVMNGALFFEDCQQARMGDPVFTEIIDHDSVRSIRVVSLSSGWRQRVFFGDAILVEDINFEMTLRKERRGKLNHWYAYRRVFGILHKRYVGLSEQITEDRLIDIARALPSR